MKTAALITLLALTGCAPPTSVQYTTEVSVTSEVAEIALSDGTKCAVYRGYKAGGISCNWPR